MVPLIHALPAAPLKKKVKWSYMLPLETVSHPDHESIPGQECAGRDRQYKCTSLRNPIVFAIILVCTRAWNLFPVINTAYKCIPARIHRWGRLVQIIHVDAHKHVTVKKTWIVTCPVFNVYKCLIFWLLLVVWIGFTVCFK